MINIVHFDYQIFYSEGIREGLAYEFTKHPNVDYYDFMSDHFGDFEKNIVELESLLPEKDVLLIHPSVKKQETVFEYSFRFPNLKIALVVSGDFVAYEEGKGIRLFSYDHKKAIVNFVLSATTSYRYSR